MPELHTFGNLLVCVNLLFQIVKSLLDVFVGVEVTGESGNLAEKFKYRQSMYIVMGYLLEIEEQRGCFE
jgi:ubiquitin conjugation factor E4 A